VLTIAQHAGIMAASALPTSSRLPPLALTAVNVELEPERDGPPGRDPHHRHLSASAANRCRDED
jgi:molybdenum cofactor biosynthesis enzyme